MTTEVITKNMYRLKPGSYNLLKVNPMNRIMQHEDPFSDPHVCELADSMKVHGFYENEPIIVGKDLVILAGHHRYFAAQKAKVPLLYVVDDEIDFMDLNKIQERAKRWSTKAFIASYSNKGIRSYQELQKTVDNYPDFPLKVIIASAVGVKNQANGDIFEDVRQGRFNYAKGITKISVEKEMDEIQKIHDCMDPENKPKGEKISMHVGLAYLWIKSHPEFNQMRFEEHIKRNVHMLIPQAGGSKSNRKMLVNIYNKGIRKGRIQVV